MRRYVENRRAPFGEAEAVRLRETFQDARAETETELPWVWPRTMREVGVGMSVMYRSDKWKRKGKYEDYKHVCESREPWKLFLAPDFEIDGVDVYGKSRTLKQAELPDKIATLALLLGAQCKFFKKRTNGELYLPPGDEGTYEVNFQRGMLAAGRTRSGELFLVGYVESEGPKFFLVGGLDVLKDGIVG